MEIMTHTYSSQIEYIAISHKQICINKILHYVSPKRI